MAKRRNGYPLRLEQWYEKEIVKLIRSWQRQATQFVQLRLKPYVSGGTKILQDAANDDPHWSEAVQQVLDLFALTMKMPDNEQQLDSLITRWVFAVDNFSSTKIKKYTGKAEMKAGINAINPLAGNKVLKNYTKGKIAENTALIKHMKQQYVDQLQADIYRNITNGGGVTDIAHAITERTAKTLRHASLIATDQTGKVLSQLDAYRSQKVGFDRYVWRSMEDGRVRPKHQALDGRVFKYDDPAGGDEGQLPGEPIRCRCYQEPVV